eukprot:3285032-Ditylum_brightwellii.AAC.1
MRRDVKKWQCRTSERHQMFRADDGRCWALLVVARQQEKTTRVGSNSEKLAAMATVRNKTVVMATANQDSDAKPVEKEAGSRQQG